MNIKLSVCDVFTCSPNRNFWTRALSIWRHGVLIFYFLEARYNKVGWGGGGIHAQRYHPVLIPIFFTIKTMGTRNTMAAGGSNEKCYAVTGSTWRYLDASLATGWATALEGRRNFRTRRCEAWRGLVLCRRDKVWRNWADAIGNVAYLTCIAMV